MSAALIKAGIVLVLCCCLVAGFGWLQSRAEARGADKLRSQYDKRDREAQEIRASDARQERAFADLQAAKHARNISILNQQLVSAHEKIFKLPGRTCLDGSTVRMLNRTGEATAAAVRTPAVDAADEAAGIATDQAVAEQIATCRVGYGKLASQLNQILDIEDRRHAPAAEPEAAP